MKKLNNCWIFFFFATSLIYLELILKSQSAQAIFTRDALAALPFTMSFAAGFYFLVILLKGKGTYIIGNLLLFISGIVYASQLIYFKLFRTYYSLYSAGNAGDVFHEFFDTVLELVSNNLGLIFMMFAPLAIFLILGLNLFDFEKSTWRKRILAASFSVLFYLMGIGALFSGSRETNSAYDLYFKSSYPVLSVEKLGLLTTIRLDLERLVVGWTPDIDITAGEEDFGSEEFTMEDSESASEDIVDSEDAESGGSPEEIPAEQPAGYNIMDIDFASLIASSENDTTKKMHEYFSSVTPTSKNDHTGMFEGYNLILITAEGFSSLAVREDVTPTLYKMATQGFRFENFYTPIWGVSTSDGEYVATTGLIPKSGVWSYAESGSNYMPFAMGNQLLSLGYTTKAYHNHTYTYYKRNISHPNMGYDYKGVGNGLVIKKTWPESDIEMMEVTMGEYTDSEPFHIYYMTVSGHMLYNFTGNYISYKNKSLVDSLPYSTAPKAYLAAQIEFDRAMELLLKTLEEKGIADRTLIAISGDHYPYGLENSEISELLGHAVETNFELYKSTFILYTPDMVSETIEEPMSSLDILPTLSNLMGLAYDSRLMMGRDIFSDAEPLVIFQNKSFICSKGRYNAVTNTFTPFEGQTVEESYINAMKNIVKNRFYYSAMILDQDYYRKVFEE